MTISYSEHVFTSAGNIFFKLLFRWKGSIYKLVWRDLVVYVVFYSLLSVMYRFLLTDNGKIYFEKVSLFCGNFATLIPITFVLGFYVSLVVTRWWKQFESIPWPDSAAVWISTCIKGHDERGRLMRRTIIRYINLCLILTLRLICLPVKKRFPTLQHLEDAGILQGRERQIFEKMDADVSHHPKYWMPLVWAGSIVTRARKENRIANDYMMLALIEQIDKFRGLAGGCINHDWVTIPLVYTQVVTLAVYTFLLSTLMGRQFLDPSKEYPGHEVDLVIPWFTFLQFFFYMGWLKVAEALINPFGEDDDDFEANWMIDRNLQVSYLIVDEMHAEHPEMVRDQFWDDLYPELPYTAAAEETRTDPILGGAADYEVEPEEAEFLPMSMSEDENEDDENEDEQPKASQDLTEVIVDANTPAHVSASKAGSRRNSIGSGSGINIKVARGATKPIEINGGGGNNLGTCVERRGEFGSYISVDKSGTSNTSRPLKQSTANSVSGVSLVSRLHSALRGRNGPGSVFGQSRISLMSRASRNRGRRSRKSSAVLARSVSRVSHDGSQQNDQDHDRREEDPDRNQSRRRDKSPRNHHSDSETTQSDEDESMFKFSSNSSIDRLNDSSHDLKREQRRRRKKNSLSSGIHSPKIHTCESGSRISVPHNCNGGHGSPPDKYHQNSRNVACEHNLTLMKKLELMHSFTSEAVKLLRRQDDNGPHTKDEHYVFRALEENHEELRRLLLRKLRPRPQRNSSIISSSIVGSPTATHGDFADTTVPSDLDLSQPLEPTPADKTMTNDSFDTTSHPSLDFEVDDLDNGDDDEDDEYDDEKSQEDLTVKYNDNTSVMESVNVSPLQDDGEDLMQQQKQQQSSQEAAAASVNTSTETPLETIEEQPEPGYSIEMEAFDPYPKTSSPIPMMEAKLNTTLEPLPEEDDSKCDKESRF